MKSFSFFFALYIFSLALMPCGDQAIAFSNEEHSDFLALDNHNSTSHDHNEDSGSHCSPFCICTCCHTPMTFQFPAKNVLLSIPFIPVSTEDHTFLYYDSPSSTYLLSIWQPPKITV